MTITEGGRIRFFKMTGSGNDFILIDNRTGRIGIEEGRSLARSACRRGLSVGADGLILIEPDHEVDFRWRFYNADGSEAEMCGNGARCAARFAHLGGIAPDRRMKFRTLAGIIAAEVSEKRVKIRMTQPHSLETDLSVPVEDRVFHLHSIHTGPPHIVVFLPDEAALRDFDVARWGRLLRYHSRFQPAGTNVNFAFLRSPQDLVLRTYERGVEAETLACGTGSIASALIAAVKQSAVSPVRVQTQSTETLIVHFDHEVVQGRSQFSEVYLEGDARVVCEAELWDETLTD